MKRAAVIFPCVLLIALCSVWVWTCWREINSPLVDVHTSAVTITNGTAAVDQELIQITIQGTFQIDSDSISK